MAPHDSVRITAAAPCLEFSTFISRLLLAPLLLFRHNQISTTIDTHIISTLNWDLLSAYHDSTKTVVRIF